jgi:hypothetical protein
MSSRILIPSSFFYEGIVKKTCPPHNPKYAEAMHTKSKALKGA